MKDIILASLTPRRAELLELAGIDFTVIKSGADEKYVSSAPCDIPAELSALKAGSVFSSLSPQQKASSIVIGADTIVSLDGEILGKPCSRGDAHRMLSLLSGKTHDVFTGVTLEYEKDGKPVLDTFCEHTSVTMYKLTDAEIDDYISTGQGDDKAGAYGIQNRACIFIKKINGDYYNVVGLPVARTVRNLNKIISEENK